MLRKIYRATHKLPLRCTHRCDGHEAAEQQVQRPWQVRLGLRLQLPHLLTLHPDGQLLACWLLLLLCFCLLFVT
jgi:hypothetical protein